MNTFLVSNNYQECAAILDMQRLNRQITECTQIAKLLRCYGDLRNEVGKLPFGVQFPPVVKLWILNDGKGRILYAELYQYFLAMSNEWKRTHNGIGHGTNFCWDRILAFTGEAKKLEWPEEVYWSHRSKLVEKDYGFYSKQFKNLKLTIPEAGEKYVWQSPKIL